MFYFKNLISGKSNFPYELGEEHEFSSFAGWQAFDGTSIENELKVTVFRKIIPARGSEAILEAARNAVKRLKLLKHPNVLAFKFSAEHEERDNIVMYLVTEKVRSLRECLANLNLPGEARGDYLLLGLHQITKAVAFLNNDCKLIHGYVCIDSIAVTDHLDWKLAGLDFVSELANVQTPVSPLRMAPILTDKARQPAELAKEKWNMISQSPPWAIDSWGLGCLMQETFGQPLECTENLRNIENIPENVTQYYQKLLASTPEQRLNPKKLSESDALKNKLVSVIHFLDDIALKDSVEKETFFRKLPSLMPHIPVPVAQAKLLPMISGALEFGGAPSIALGPILQIGKTLESEEFKVKIIPTISRLFSSTNRTIRRSLLESIDSYGSYLDQATLESQIYPQVALGFNDQTAYIRELTLKSMLVMAPKLTQKTLNQSLLKHLAKLQVDEEASIRANTTILLGNVAKYLTEATCKRVLINAFTRAMKDTFPPARVAGIKVRLCALECLDVFTKILKDHSKKMDEEAVKSGTKESSPASSGWASGLGESLGWAISTAANLRSSQEAVQPSPGKKTLHHTESSPILQSHTPATLSPTPEKAGSTDWDDADGWSDTNLDADVGMSSSVVSDANMDAELENDIIPPRPKRHVIPKSTLNSGLSSDEELSTNLKKNVAVEEKESKMVTLKPRTTSRQTHTNTNTAGDGVTRPAQRRQIVRSKTSKSMKLGAQKLTTQFEDLEL